jgi:hypothetical protein
LSIKGKFGDVNREKDGKIETGKRLEKIETENRKNGEIEGIKGGADRR